MSGLEAAEVMERGGSLREVGRCFGSKEEGLVYFGSVQQERYPPGGASACCVCGARPGVPHEFRWTASFASKGKPSSAGALAMDVALLFMGMVRTRTTSTVVSFVTTHGFCAACGRKHLMRKGLANVLQFFALLAGVISLFIGPMGVAGYFYFRNDPQSRNDLMGWLLAGVGGLAVLGLCAWALSVTEKLRVPVGLRGVGQFPFRVQYSKRVKG